MTALLVLIAIYFSYRIGRRNGTKRALSEINGCIEKYQTQEITGNGCDKLSTLNGMALMSNQIQKHLK